ncbi:MAG: transposase [Polyangiaceae bacterium]|jgi:hypothetical protein
MAVGAVHGVALTVHAIGHGLASATGAFGKSAIKQVDRLLSNTNLDLGLEVFPAWVAFVVAARTEIVVALDWTEFDADGHATIALHMVTSHGRATPLMWKTHEKATLKAHRNEHEDVLLKRLREILPVGVRTIVLADRGFGDQALYGALGGARLDFAIRFRGNIRVQSAQGESRTAAEWVPKNGQARKLADARVTGDRSPVATVVCVKATEPPPKSSLCTASASPSRKTFATPRTCAFGMGLSSSHIGRTDRRDRLLLIGALAQALLTLLGAAAEDCGLDRTMKANTVKRRTHSLFRQGCFFYSCIPMMPDERLELLMNSFRNIVAQHAVFRQIFAVI